MTVLFDSTVLIDCLRGVESAKQTVRQYPGSSISIISWIEVLAGAPNDDEKARLKSFLENFVCLPLDNEVVEAAAALRRGRNLKLPDAVILATAQIYGAILMTRSSRNFPEHTPGVRIAYTV